MRGATAGSAGENIRRRSALDMLWLELTTRCNLHCTHCYADSGADRPLEGAMTLADWRAAIDEALELGLSALQFIGGEPTLHPHFRTLLDYAGRARLALVEVYTNATCLTDELVGRLLDNGARVAASFYADAPEVHDAITMRPGSWRRTVAGLERALAAGLPVRIGIIETAANSAAVPGAIAFLRRLGIRDIGIDAERGVGRARRQPPVDVPGEDFSQLCGQCGSARLCVTATGAVYPCVFARRTPLGDVREGLRAALWSARLAGFRTLMDLEQQSRLGSRQRSSFCQPGPCSPRNTPCNPDEQPCSPEIRPCRPWEHRAHGAAA